MRIQKTLTVLLVALSGCANWEKFDGYIATAPSASVMQASYVPSFAKRFSSLELSRVEEFTGRGATGVTQFQTTVMLTVEEGGFTKEAIRQTWGHSPDGTIRGLSDTTQISVCGLQPIARELAGTTVLPNLSIIATPNLITTYSSDEARTVLERSVVQTLSGDVARMCKPTPGADYTYQLSRQAQLRWSAAQNLRQSLSAQIRCRTAEAKVAADRLVPGIEGDALELKCNAKYDKDGEQASRYAFFEALGIYLPLETAEPERGRTVFRYAKAVSSVTP